MFKYRAKCCALTCDCVLYFEGKKKNHDQKCIAALNVNKVKFFKQITDVHEITKQN